MARLARVVVPGVPHHVTQRGNRRQQTFFEDDDYRAYIDLMAEWCGRQGVAVWAYCLMPNHVHLIAVPDDEDGLRRAMGEAHRRFSVRVNRRQGWAGHLWQGRFASYPMDQGHLLACARYVELNPVRAGLVARPADWPWSSAKAHLERRDDGLCRVGPLLDLAGKWRAFLGQGVDAAAAELFRKHESTGRPLGPPSFIASLEETLGRALKPGKRGRKRKGTEKDLGN